MSAAANRRIAVQPTDHVPSPCISVCAMDAEGMFCLGCFRTLDEIAMWSVLDADGKRAVLAALPARRAARSAPRPDSPQ
jgi:predicted Fe-S protein YdhL (DUF1289 family)